MNLKGEKVGGVSSSSFFLGSFSSGVAAVVIFVVWMEWGGALLLLQLFLYSPVCLFLEEMEEVEGGGYGGGTRAFKRLTMMMGALVLSGAHWPPLIRAIIATVTHTHTHTQTTTTKNRRNALGRH